MTNGSNERLDRVEANLDRLDVAAREALQRRKGLAAMSLWERQHGRFTAEEMDEARRKVRAQFRTRGLARSMSVRFEIG